MQHSNREIWYVLLALIIITAVYSFVYLSLNAEISASSFFGHILGVIGFILMLMTEFLYSARKRYHRAARMGKMETWLEFHIFTGVIGPYLVLLHTDWNFRGLAGVVTLLMILIVISGFIGRYIYTLTPRTAAGIELNDRDLEYHLGIVEAKLQYYIAEHPTILNDLPQVLICEPLISKNIWSLTIGRIFAGYRFHWSWWQATRGMNQRYIKDIKHILDSRRQLYYQIASMLIARRMLAIWHAVHVPLGVALFITAFVHIGAAMYYVTLAK